MPFTFSHPAIVLPLNYLPARYISLTGLVVGSMVPDFEYFIRFKAGSEISHTLLGVFIFNLPLGILLTFLFHNVVRDSLIENLPSFFRNRFSSYKDFNWNHHFKKKYVIISLSLIIGAFSHIAWDSFTHESGIFVQMFPFLLNNYSGMALYRYFQHGSTLIGASVILFAIRKLPELSTSGSEIHLKYWLIVGLAIFIAPFIRILTGVSFYAYPHMIVSAISGFFIGLILASLYLKIRDCTEKLL
jgi:hypothetical protein